MTTPTSDIVLYQSGDGVYHAMQPWRALSEARKEMYQAVTASALKLGELFDLQNPIPEYFVALDAIYKAWLVVLLPTVKLEEWDNVSLEGKQAQLKEWQEAQGFRFTAPPFAA